MPIPLLAIYGATAAVKAGLGAYQLYQGQKLARNNDINNQKLPQEYLQNLKMAKRMAGEGLPQQQYNRSLMNIYANQGTGLKFLRDTGVRSDAGKISSIVGNTNKALENLGAQDVAQKLKNQSLLMSYNDMIARAKKQSFDEQAAAARGMQGAGIQNVGGAVESFASNALMSDIYGGGEEDAAGVGAKKGRGKLAALFGGFRGLPK